MVSVRPLLHAAAVLTLLVSTQGALVIQGVFALRQDHIAEHICENRHDPDSECEGMCFFEKRMEHHHGHEDEAPKAVLTAPTLTAVAVPEAVVPPDRWQEAATPGMRPGLGESPGVTPDVFHPPRRA
ncbi:MAG: hypothetical protein AAF845_18700 [Bacteroidota bacterium]